MAATTQDSVLLARRDTFPRTFNDPHEMYGALRFALVDFTQSGQGDAGSIARLVQLPAGKVRLILPLSRLVISDLGASATFDLGWEAYTALDGSAVDADPNGLDDGVDVSTGPTTLVPSGTLGGDETKVFSSKSGVVITGQVNDDTFDDAVTVKGYLVFVHI